ncbi:MAG: AIPR family protein [Nitrospirae bacterium]|nr:AIPR family protein [Nitrospirota bacterium]
MYDKIKEEIKQDYYKQNFPNEGQRFVAWYLMNIHLRDKNETKDCITDGPDDKQIDAIVIDDDKATVFVIQGKFIGSDKVDAAPLREVLSSWIQLKDLVRLQEVGNIKLKRKLAEVATALEDDYDVSFELITTSSLTDAAKTDLATFQEQLANAEDLAATIHLVDQDELRRRYDMALEKDNPSIRHTIKLEPNKYLKMDVGGTQAVLAAIQLKDCLSFPGVKDGTLFQKNVRQSLGLNNAVNKGIKNTIYGDKHRDFFFFHNGITAICNKMTFNAENNLELQGLSVVNGCQSLNTILSCSERVKTVLDTYIMFRFYEIPQRDRADRISISTNSQSAVKPRDLRSNDKRVLNLKRVFEQKYAAGYFITKRGEAPPAEKDRNYVLDLSDFGKYLISWHSQRPNIAYSEAKIFDKYFEQLFKRNEEYKPEKAQALNFWMTEIMKGWVPANPLGLNESLLAMKAYAPFHQLYATSICFSKSNNQIDRVPNPFACWERVQSKGLVEQIVQIAGTCLNTALEAAANEPLPQNRVFSPQNWIKTKTCLSGINAAVGQYFAMLPSMPGGKELSKNLRESLALPVEDFEYRWAAD